MNALFGVIVVAALLGGACSSSTARSGGRTQVSATDDSCKPAKTTFQSGKHSFEIQNDGRKVTELYVYGPADKIIGEVEDVGPGSSRKLSVSLKPGAYELACKPGQTGRGIRVPITVS